VIEVKWVPGSENLFVAALNDGTLLVFDKDLDEKPLNIIRDKVQIFKIIKPETRVNPLAAWVVSNSSIKAFEFSPDCRHLATVTKEGLLRVFDFTTEKLLVTFKSYFGGFTCVCWSPDGKYILVGLFTCFLYFVRSFVLSNLVFSFVRLEVRMT
jgi:hypothetical protein